MSQAQQVAVSQRISELLFIYSLTPTHPGSGRGGEIVDLQVQRDEFGIPVIWASGLKGVFRSNLTLRCGGDTACKERVRAIFGPEAGSREVSDYASSVVFLDARLLLIPARSLRGGVWTYVTSPHLLNYYLTYLEALTEYNNALNQLKDSLMKLIDRVRSSVGGGVALVSSGRVLMGGNKAVINELEFNAKVDSDAMKLFLSALPKDVGGDKVSQAGLVFISDDDINEVIRRGGLVIQTRVRLNYESKTVVSGALWEEEYLPQFTIMVSGIVCSGIRRSWMELAMTNLRRA